MKVSVSVSRPVDRTCCDRCGNQIFGETRHARCCICGEDVCEACNGGHTVHAAPTMFYPTHSGTEQFSLSICVRCFRADPATLPREKRKTLRLRLKLFRDLKKAAARLEDLNRRAAISALRVDIDRGYGVIGHRIKAEHDLVDHKDHNMGPCAVRPCGRHENAAHCVLNARAPKLACCDGCQDMARHEAYEASYRE